MGSSEVSFGHEFVAAQQISNPVGVSLNPIEIIRWSLTMIAPTFKLLHVDNSANRSAVSIYASVHLSKLCPTEDLFGLDLING